MTFSRNFGRIAGDETNAEDASSPHSMEKNVHRLIKVYLYVKVVLYLSEGRDNMLILADSAKQIHLAFTEKTF